MKKLHLALCIAAVITTTTSYANGHGGHNPPHSDGESSIEIDKKVKVSIDADYNIDARIRTSGLGAAVIENDQRVIGNGQGREPSNGRGPGGHHATNYYHSNTSTISEKSFEGIKGNVGVNIADGDHNVQANNVAAATVAERAENDATFAFGGHHGGHHGGYANAGDAEIFSNQVGRGNQVANYASTNRSIIDDSAFDGASGNIGVNMTSGNDNIQANNLALSTYDGQVGIATVNNAQTSANNQTTNRSVVVDRITRDRIRLRLNASGRTRGTSELAEGYYPEVWVDTNGDGAHGTGHAIRVGHIDFDENNPTGSEKMTFNEVGNVTLRGSVTGFLPTRVVQVKQKTSNSSHIENAFRGGVSGNVGVNISAGTGNLQNNSLSLVSLTPAP